MMKEWSAIPDEIMTAAGETTTTPSLSTVEEELQSLVAETSSSSSSSSNSNSSGGRDSSSNISSSTATATAAAAAARLGSTTRARKFATRMLIISALSVIIISTSLKNWQPMEEFAEGKTTTDNSTLYDQRQMSIVNLPSFPAPSIFLLEKTAAPPDPGLLPSVVHANNNNSTTTTVTTTTSNVLATTDDSDQDQDSNNNHEEEQEEEEDDDECYGKDHLIRILKSAGLTDIDCKSLPKWKEVTDLYGREPIIHGLDTCERYRELLHNGTQGGIVQGPLIRIAGLLNTGTHALSESLIMNYKPWDGTLTESPYQVPWGKHVSVKYRWNSTIPWYNNDSKAHVLPVVIVKDPFRWFQSMCKSSYMVHWEHVLGHCPNLVKQQQQKGETKGGGPWSTYNVTIPYWRSTFTDHYDSLAHLWSTWYREYYEADFPRLMIRYEDLLYHAEQVMRTVTECAGTPMEQNQAYRYKLDKSKNCGDSSNFVSSLSKYGTEKGRYDCLTVQDVEYAATALDSELMSAFHYRYVPDSMIIPPPSPKNASSSAGGGVLCPGHDPDPNSITGWLDKRATYTDDDYAKELIARPWRRPGESGHNSTQEEDAAHIVAHIAKLQRIRKRIEQAGLNSSARTCYHARSYHTQKD